MLNYDGIGRNKLEKAGVGWNRRAWAGKGYNRFEYIGISWPFRKSTTDMTTTLIQI